jgi:hypothetical protein
MLLTKSAINVVWTTSINWQQSRIASWRSSSESETSQAPAPQFAYKGSKAKSWHWGYQVGHATDGSDQVGYIDTSTDINAIPTTFLVQ